MPNVAIIRTSDRMGFRSCRRRWDFQSHLKRNLEPKQTVVPLWFGTGFHFAMENIFVEGGYASGADAFRAFVKATDKSQRQDMPSDWAELQELGVAMLTYFEDIWLPRRNGLKTYIHDGRPQTEINFRVDVPFNPKDYYPDSPYDKVEYSGTIDRVIEDEDGILWLVDYKTAKTMKTTHFSNDSQIAAYCWAASHMYPGKQVGGMIYWQFLKEIPKGPKELMNETFSVAQNQRTSHPLYKKALVEKYGDVEKAPSANIDFLNVLGQREGPDHDTYVRRDTVYKNQASLEAEGQKILLELIDMLNPNLPMYPNPTFMCPNMCSFYEVCSSMDDGSDWENQLAGETQQRATMDESWRAYLPSKEEI